MHDVMRDLGLMVHSQGETVGEYCKEMVCVYNNDDMVML